MTASGTRPTLTVHPLAAGSVSRKISGAVVCPPDKSITHRSVMFAAMAKGASVIENPLMGADCRATMAAFRALGATITHDAAAGVVRVESPGMDGWSSPLLPLDFANSGTTARLLAGIFAAIPGLFVTCYGDASLSKRPMGRVVEPLRAIGAKIYGRQNGHLLPLAIEGQKLAPKAHVVDKASAQVKSAILLAGLNVSGETKVTLPVGGRDHTEKMLAALGAQITTKRVGGGEEITVTGPFRPQAGRFRVPGDPSSAAFFSVYAALAGGKLEIQNVLENPTRTGFMTVLERMGVRLTRSQPKREHGLLEPVTTLSIESDGKPVRGVDTEPELAPTMIDEIPILAVLAAFASGPSRFRGLSELRVKESDRLAKTLELLLLAGADAKVDGDDLVVAGGLTRARAFRYDPDEDHRLCMAAAVLAKLADGPCEVQDPDCVAVSFPGFFDVLNSLG